MIEFLPAGPKQAVLMRKTFSLLLLVVSLPLCAQTPYLVKDINTTNPNGARSSSPSDFAAFGNRTFFAATTGDAGRELWATDGTSSGTSMVADIVPGTGSSSPRSLTVVNGVLLFVASDADHGTELWTSDGTAAGTRLFLDIDPGPTSSSPSPPTAYKNRLLFTAFDGTNGREPWITDGTVAGTRMLKDINPGSASSSLTSFVTMGDSVYFLATGGLWKTDGTDSGTVNVAAVSARNLTSAGSQLFFEGFTAASNWELWVSDGTGAGTRMVTEIAPGTNAAFDSAFASVGPAPFGDRVLFAADDGVHGREMWVSDGTAAGTHMVRDFIPGENGLWDGDYLNFAVLGGRAYFQGGDRELWVTDGTDAGTVFFADLYPGGLPSFPFGFHAVNGKIYFAAINNNAIDFQLFVTDGTVAGTHAINGADGPRFGNLRNSAPMWPVNGKVYFSGTTPKSGSEPWVSDGTDAGTRMIANLAADPTSPTASSGPGMLTAAGNLLFFYAIEGTVSPLTGLQESSLWRTDGTEAGTFKLMETGHFPGTLMPVGPLVFFEFLFPETNKALLMMSDGTVAGTKPADDFMRRFGQRKLVSFFSFGDTVFATLRDLYDGACCGNDSSLWKTTAALDDSATQLGSLNQGSLTEVAGHYVFFAQSPDHSFHYGLWTTDGTPAGTYAIRPDMGNIVPNGVKLVNAAGTIFFLYAEPGQNGKLWKSDGTMDGTTVVKELPTSAVMGTEIKAAGRNVFFVAGGSLWTSDGTESGTIELATVKFFPTQESDDLRAAGNRVVFTQSDLTTGLELWGSDGTKEGTILLQKLKSFPQTTSIDGTVYFAGADDAHGTEIWTTDGTAAGTKMLVDLNPGPASSNPGGFTKLGNLLYFSAYTDATGSELWAMPFTTPALSISDSRSPEGDTGTTVAHVNVSLTPAATQTVTVDYATSDGTAHAGDDYEAASGTLTFAPGETAKIIDVHVRGDVLPENNETFFITLRNASGARVTRSEAVGIIEDDDQIADISVASSFQEADFTVSDTVTVSNNGPRAATDIAMKFTATPSGDRVYTGCAADCPIPQLAAGASSPAYNSLQIPQQQVFLSVTASPRQRDPQPSNNSVMWTVNATRNMAMNAGYLTTAATATVTAKLFSQPLVLTSSDPTVVAVPSAVTKVTAGLGTFTVTALKPGSSTIKVDGRQFPLVVTVIAPGTQPRWPGGVTLFPNFTGTRFDFPITITVTPSGTAPVSGATATGTVTVTAAGQELARIVIAGTRPIAFPVYLPSLGQIPYVVSYSGDANFLPDSLSTSVFVNSGQVVMTGGLEQVPGTTGTYALTVRATGSPLTAPTGILSVVNGGTEVAKVTLVPSGGGISFGHATISNLPAAATLTVNYPGDALYQAGSQQVRLVETRRRSAGH